jgi:hypothetical protein
MPETNGTGHEGSASQLIVDAAFNHQRLIEFLEPLLHDGKHQGKEIFLTLDNRRASLQTGEGPIARLSVKR